MFPGHSHRTWPSGRIDTIGRAAHLGVSQHIADGRSRVPDCARHGARRHPTKGRGKSALQSLAIRKFIVRRLPGCSGFVYSLCSILPGVTGACANITVRSCSPCLTTPLDPLRRSTQTLPNEKTVSLFSRLVLSELNVKVAQALGRYRFQTPFDLAPRVAWELPVRSHSGLRRSPLNVTIPKCTNSSLR
jgi:hypothetical protein